jgi:hypothetical protein
MSRFTVTIAGTLNAPVTEAEIHRDAPIFLRSVEDVHDGIEANSVRLVSVEAIPEPTPDTDAMSEAEARIAAEAVRLYRESLSTLDR